MSKSEQDRALLRAFRDAARLIQALAEMNGRNRRSLPQVGELEYHQATHDYAHALSPWREVYQREYAHAIASAWGL